MVRVWSVYQSKKDTGANSNLFHYPMELLPWNNVLMFLFFYIGFVRIAGVLLPWCLLSTFPL